MLLYILWHLWVSTVCSDQYPNSLNQINSRLHKIKRLQQLQAQYTYSIDCIVELFAQLFFCAKNRISLQFLLKPFIFVSRTIKHLRIIAKYVDLYNAFFAAKYLTLYKSHCSLINCGYTYEETPKFNIWFNC